MYVVVMKLNSISVRDLLNYRLRVAQPQQMSLSRLKICFSVAVVGPRLWSCLPFRYLGCC